MLEKFIILIIGAFVHKNIKFIISIALFFNVIEGAEFKDKKDFLLRMAKGFACSVKSNSESSLLEKDIGRAREFAKLAKKSFIAVSDYAERARNEMTIDEAKVFTDLEDDAKTHYEKAFDHTKVFFYAYSYKGNFFINLNNGGSFSIGNERKKSKTD